MFRANANFDKLPGSYLFAEIKRRVDAYKASAEGEKKRIISLGIGDVTLPLGSAITGAMIRAAAEMGEAATFRGYGPDHGYDFLVDKIVEHDYRKRGVTIDKSEVFLSDGAKSDCGNIGDILSTDCRVAVCDPVYPVYVDTNAMAGRAGEFGADGRWSDLVYMPCVPENGFVPKPPLHENVDVVYLCYPNNPTGGVATKEELTLWVNYAQKNGVLILYDSAYEAFITDNSLPRSIYEIDGAKSCAIEFRSFSKTAGFTGVRCAYTVVPKELKAADGVSMNAAWSRRQATKMNGVSYVVQRGAEAVYSAEGSVQCKKNVEYYMENASIIRDGVKRAGADAWGGVNAPYVWMKTPGGLSSWAYFDIALERAGVIGTPGVGFGPSGEGYFRLTAFGSREDTVEAVKRLTEL